MQWFTARRGEFCKLEGMAKETRVAVITGAGQGIGRKTAEVLAAKGYALALNDLRPPEATLASVRAIGVEAIEALGDVSSETDVARISLDVEHYFGRVDLLVN